MLLVPNKYLGNDNAIYRKHTASSLLFLAAVFCNVVFTTITLLAIRPRNTIIANLFITITQQKH